MKSSNQAFVNKLVIYTLGMLCVSGSAGLGAVWLRHQMSVTANQIQLHKAEMAALSRRLAETTTAIEAEQSPAALERRNQEWRLNLVAPKELQVCRVNEDVEVRLATKRNQNLILDGRTMILFRPEGGRSVR